MPLRSRLKKASVGHNEVQETEDHGTLLDHVNHVVKAEPDSEEELAPLAEEYLPPSRIFFTHRGIQGWSRRDAALRCNVLREYNCCTSDSQHKQESHGGLLDNQA